MRCHSFSQMIRYTFFLEEFFWAVHLCPSSERSDFFHEESYDPFYRDFSLWFHVDTFHRKEYILDIYEYLSVQKIIEVTS